MTKTVFKDDYFQETNSFALLYLLKMQMIYGIYALITSFYRVTSFIFS